MIKKNGFTFVEVITTVAIIGVLATIAAISIRALQMNGRDARRVSDINEIRNALSLYYSKYNQYPTSITPGQRFQLGNTIFMEKVPSNPTPRNDGNCNDSEYIYETQNNNISYTINFCLGDNFADIRYGNNQAVPEGIIPN
ncbi:MAG: type II secretion system protein [Candidatus Falkowbacteria bacterium]|nr:type II secretion system protein [Candidatus Falkowbacteria bacterium]